MKVKCDPNDPTSLACQRKGLKEKIQQNNLAYTTTTTKDLDKTNKPLTSTSTTKTRNTKSKERLNVFSIFDKLYKTVSDLHPDTVKESFSPELRQKVLHIEASSVFANENFNPENFIVGAQKEVELYENIQALLDENGNGEWDINPFLSNYDGLVLQNRNNPNDIHIAYHGASSNPNYLEEDKADIISVIKGEEHTRPSFQRAEDLFEEVKDNFPKATIEPIGYSLGSAKAIHIGEKFNIESTTFNPFLSPLQKVSNNVSTAKQNIHRVITDWTTSGALHKPTGTNREITHYSPNENLFDITKDPFHYSTNPHGLHQFLNIPSEESTIIKPSLTKSILRGIGTGLDIAMLGLGAYDATQLAKRKASPQQYSNRVSESMNPYGLLGINISPEYQYTRYQDAPIEARVLGNLLTGHMKRDADRMTEFERNVQATQNTHRYTETEKGLVDELGTKYTVYESHETTKPKTYNVDGKKYIGTKM